MNSPAAPLALIRTRPLGQGNYGGILQAFALQRALAALGADSVTDLSPGVVASFHGQGAARLKTAVKRALVRVPLLGASNKVWIADAIRPLQNEGLMRFVSEQIRTVNLYDSMGQVDDSILRRADFFVTGSDQVWRAAFGRVPTYLFDFLSDDDPRPRIAYAASFGTDTHEYGRDLVEQTRNLAQRLGAVSVREASGVEFARQLWDVEPLHVLDPTMLLDVDVYSALADSATDAFRSSRLITYVLDEHPSIQRTVMSVANHLQWDPTPLLPSVPQTFRAYRRNPGRYTRPSVEGWLNSIRQAEFVVTDSFHGTVFSILFNRPFISIVNRQRGSARFESLLAKFDLESRLVEPGSSVTRELIEMPIEWAQINAKIAKESHRSVEFLRSALTSVLEERSTS